MRTASLDAWCVTRCTVKLCMSSASCGQVRIVSPNQLKAARLLLRMTQEDLAQAAKVARATVNRHESGKAIGEGQIRLMQYALEAAGVVFIPARTMIDGRPIQDGIGMLIEDQ